MSLRPARVRSQRLAVAPRRQRIRPTRRRGANADEASRLTEDEKLFNFVRSHVPTVWTLELLLVLKRDPDRRWSSEQLVAELRGSEAVVTAALGQLKRAGLARIDEHARYGYEPALPGLAASADQLDQAYRERPFTIIKWIAAPEDKLRSLADAFKFRRDP